MPSRRHVLALLAASPFLSACGAGDLPDPVAGWREPGAAEADPRRFGLAHAILAPNPHNTQPWLVELRGEEEMLLYCDLDRRLPFTDPLDRQITIGCGAFLYLYWTALIQRGFVCQFEFFPEGAPAPGARLDERPLALVRTRQVENAQPEREYYYAQILARRTNREPFEVQVPSDDSLRRLAAATTDWYQPDAQALTADWRNDLERVTQLRDLVWRGFDRELRTAGAQEETYGWLRFGRTERARTPDGLFVDVPMPGVLRTLGMLDKADIVDPDSDASKRAAEDWRRKIDTAPAFIWFSTADDAPLTRLIAGMAYARMNLAATADGMALHPWSQTLQEYAEMADLYAEAKMLLGVDATRTVQMLARVGYAAPVEPAARRALDQFVRA